MSEILRNQENEQQLDEAEKDRMEVEERRKIYWKQIKELIKVANENFHGVDVDREYYESIVDRDWEDSEDSPLDVNEFGGFNYFLQEGGVSVEVKRVINEFGLHAVEDVIFKSKDGKVLINLSNILPEKYIIVEEAERDCDFIVPSLVDPVIVMHPGFLESRGGRITFLHEIGHAIDYRGKPMSLKEKAKYLKGFGIKEREDSAWQKARDLVKFIREKGLEFLPGLENIEDTKTWEEYAKKAVSSHKYQENFGIKEG